MKKELFKTLIDVTKHVAQHEMRKGNPSRAAAACLIGSGLAALPIPIVGVPLILAGVAKLARR